MTQPTRPSAPVTPISASAAANQEAAPADGPAAKGPTRGWVEVAAALAKPFEAGQIHYRPGATTKGKDRQTGKYPPGTKAMRLPFIDARDVEDRLDDAVGPSRWQDTYRVLDERTCAVECGIGMQMADGLWVWKYDVGYPNAAEDADKPEKEPLKAAFSDAFKRAAIKWRVGRHIYRMARQWAAIDADGRFGGAVGSDEETVATQSAPARPPARPAQQPRAPAASAR